jgi:hypothetical protein
LVCGSLETLLLVCLIYLTLFIQLLSQINLLWSLILPFQQLFSTILLALLLWLWFFFLPLIKLLCSLLLIYFNLQYSLSFLFINKIFFIRLWTSELHWYKPSIITSLKLSLWLERYWWLETKSICLWLPVSLWICIESVLLLLKSTIASSCSLE